MLEKFKLVTLLYVIPIFNFLMLFFDFLKYELTVKEFVLFVLSNAAIFNATNTGIACTMGMLETFDENDNLLKNRSLIIAFSSLTFLYANFIYKEVLLSYTINLWFSLFIVLFHVSITVILSILIINDYLKIHQFQIKLIKKHQDELSKKDKKEIIEIQGIQNIELDGENYHV
jgi:hypothetical protein